MNHNRIQDACSGEPELVVGEIYGLRQWQMHAPATDPYLVGHFSMAWDLYGTNVATCNIQSEGVETTFTLKPADFESSELSPGKAVAYFAHAFFEQYPDLESLFLSLVGSPYPGLKMLVFRDEVSDRENLPDLELVWDVQVSGGGWVVNENVYTKKRPIDFRIQADNPVHPHEVTLPECKCGLYAYTDEKSLKANSRTHGDTVFGLVRAHGLVTQGTKGFRAQKAEIVALTKPQGAVNTTVKGADRSFFGPIYYHDLLVQRKEIWVPNTEETIVLGFQRMVPDHISVLETLEDLITLSSHFLEPPEKDKT